MDVEWWHKRKGRKAGFGMLSDSVMVIADHPGAVAEAGGEEGARGAEGGREQVGRDVRHVQHDAGHQTAGARWDHRTSRTATDSGQFVTHFLSREDHAMVHFRLKLLWIWWTVLFDMLLEITALRVADGSYMIEIEIFLLCFVFFCCCLRSRRRFICCLYIVCLQLVYRKIRNQLLQNTSNTFLTLHCEWESDANAEKHASATGRQSNCYFLGVTLDTRLTWKTHLEAVAARSVTKLGLLKKLAGTTWGADTHILRRVYTEAARPIM